ncbi:MAG: MerR family transcriptional regulator [Chloroflexota bacterium]|jgi:MerR family transcriptional regulator/heat shock protein HspR
MGRPLYSISVVSELLEQHPETLRVWERAGLLKPARRNSHRLYSNEDLARLRFIKGLLDKGLNLAGVRAIIELYPCWLMDSCPKCARTTESSSCSKPCWKEAGTFCQVGFLSPTLCTDCEFKKS